jgi:carbamoyltransferase
MFVPYLGKVYSEEEIDKNLTEYRDQINIVLFDDVYQDAAQAIADGYIIGWFQDGCECGPRALGNRSILADPRDPDMKRKINSRVKFREAFRPFAPSILWEHQEEYFDLDLPSPYMLMIANIWPCMREKIPAVTHIDGTGRLQTVMSDLNPKFYKLIETFYKITGVPIVLNTSFNIAGEPIVETPGDAVRSFLKSNFDYLYISNYKISKVKE